MTAPTQADGRLVDNILHFARALRKAGVRVGSGQVETAIQAVAATGFAERVDFYHTLRATLIMRATDLELYHQVFAMFWRDPEFLDAMMYMLSPELTDDAEPAKSPHADRRARDALGDGTAPKAEPKPREEIVEYAAFTWSDAEVLSTKDFEQMSNSELSEAHDALRHLTLPVKPLRTRRFRPGTTGQRPDARATLRAAMRRAGEIDQITRKAPLERAPDLVALCDISGSMASYSRVLLRYLHALAHARTRSWGKVHAFTFGTQLTNITRGLDLGDPDAALASVGTAAQDWEGGTQIGTAIETFNKAWSRRVLSRGAIVLLITDGLERGDLELLNREAARLRRSARHVIWLNPLLRWDGFEPRASGVKILYNQADKTCACHSLDSLKDLSMVLSKPISHTPDRA
ncbi:MAG: VWA domain-containing protein [Rhodobacteraceae bacterium]|nr:VWA domain-containing protein [Paracoccaceae bacterium]